MSEEVPKDSVSEAASGAEKASAAAPAASTAAPPAPDSAPASPSSAQTAPAQVGASATATVARATATPPKPAADAPAPPAPPKPAKPAAKAAAAEPEGMPRRKFILGLAWGAFTAAMASCGIAMTRFMYPNVLVEPPSIVKIGYPEDYATGEVDERWKEKYAFWVVRDDHGIYVLSSVCTHLGCPPNWLKTEDKFKCPCHGSGFYRTGMNFEGPAPRPLERFSVIRSADGQIVVNKNRKFQQEKGQWEDPEAYLRLA